MRFPLLLDMNTLLSNIPEFILKPYFYVKNFLLESLTFLTISTNQRFVVQFQVFFLIQNPPKANKLHNKMLHIVLTKCVKEGNLFDSIINK